jgi:ribosomal protein S18 acetylase RimI-like enzyme
MRLFARCGMQPARLFQRMRRPLAVGVEPFPAPEGISVVPWRDELGEAAREAHNDAFRDHWNHHPSDADRWRHESYGAAGFRDDLSCLALAGSEVAGYLIGLDISDPDLPDHRVGQIALVGVRQAYRRRGLASALLAWSLERFQARDFHHVDLGVDSDSPTGAPAVYERSGFVVHKRFVIHALELPPAEEGRDEASDAVLG